MAAQKNTARPSDKPAAPTKRFDADAFQLEGAVGPFPFSINGHEYEFLDPRELDYRVAQAAEDRDWMTVLQSCLPESQRYRFFQEKIPGPRFEALMRAYMDHANLGNSPASPTS